MCQDLACGLRNQANHFAQIMCIMNVFQPKKFVKLFVRIAHLVQGSVTAICPKQITHVICVWTMKLKALTMGIASIKNQVRNRYIYINIKLILMHSLINYHYIKRVFFKAQLFASLQLYHQPNALAATLTIQNVMYLNVHQLCLKIVSVWPFRFRRSISQIVLEGMIFINVF